ncbi:unnamed protein product [Caenorhabditis auriculariae]|uniref:Uncharacterized protein n=1 Tax=Caenorhabditis auriculariae TaxID=2777116 RepID=A0A8S1H6W7_9PELO|nr:unnamed protein product [Caenorhabditis auriculariae]
MHSVPISTIIDLYCCLVAFPLTHACDHPRWLLYCTPSPLLDSHYIEFTAFLDDFSAVQLPIIFDDLLLEVLPIQPINLPTEKAMPRQKATRKKTKTPGSHHLASNIADKDLPLDSITESLANMQIELAPGFRNGTPRDVKTADIIRALNNLKKLEHYIETKGPDATISDLLEHLVVSNNNNNIIQLDLKQDEKIDSLELSQYNDLVSRLLQYRRSFQRACRRLRADKQRQRNAYRRFLVLLSPGITVSSKSAFKTVPSQTEEQQQIALQRKIDSSKFMKEHKQQMLDYMEQVGYLKESLQMDHMDTVTFMRKMQVGPMKIGSTNPTYAPFPGVSALSSRSNGPVSEQAVPVWCHLANMYAGNPNWLANPTQKISKKKKGDTSPEAPLYPGLKPSIFHSVEELSGGSSSSSESGVTRPVPRTANSQAILKILSEGGKKKKKRLQRRVYIFQTPTKEKCHPVFELMQSKLKENSRVHRKEFSKRCQLKCAPEVIEEERQPELHDFPDVTFEGSSTPTPTPSVRQHRRNARRRCQRVFHFKRLNLRHKMVSEAALTLGLGVKVESKEGYEALFYAITKKTKEWNVYLEEFPALHFVDMMFPQLIDVFDDHGLAISEFIRCKKSPNWMKYVKICDSTNSARSKSEQIPIPGRVQLLKPLSPAGSALLLEDSKPKFIVYQFGEDAPKFRDLDGTVLMNRAYAAEDLFDTNAPSDTSSSVCPSPEIDVVHY